MNTKFINFKKIHENNNEEEIKTWFSDLLSESLWRVSIQTPKNERPIEIYNIDLNNYSDYSTYDLIHVDSEEFNYENKLKPFIILETWNPTLFILEDVCKKMDLLDEDEIKNFIVQKFSKFLRIETTDRNVWMHLEWIISRLSKERKNILFKDQKFLSNAILGMDIKHI